MLKRMLIVYGTLITVFHKFITPIFTSLNIFLLHIVVSIGIVLDHLFFPSIRKIKPKPPIVVVGNPRSGTTFMQRFLVTNGFGAGSRLWKMMYPSLTLQVLIKPLLPILEKFSPAKHHATATHSTSLTGIETDDPALLFRYFDGFFLYGFFLAWAKKDYKDMFDPAIRDTSKRDFNWMEKVWRRNLISEKKDRMIPKIFSLGVRIPLFLKKFPDAKILYTVRDPLQTVPSGMSLVTGVLDGWFGFWKLPEAKRNHFIERLYTAFLDLSMRFHNDYVSGKIPEKNLKIVTFPRMMKDFDKLMHEILDFIGEKATPELENSIKETDENQKKFKSTHKYDLAKYGLDEAKIRKDFAPIYETFFNEQK
ncbi:sulfotransferase [candidate division KSB1 bacterium]|nr:sulfotransferase [candidate division KSB1 bacterium]